MIINKIYIKNFQSYYNDYSLEFSNGLNIVIGNGGKGKSKLFNAFYWVLFGKIYITGIGWCSTDTLPHSAKLTMKRHGFINSRALFKAEVDDEVITLVQLELTDDKGRNYNIERSVSAIRKDCNDWDSDNAWDVKTHILTVSFDTLTGTKVVNDSFAEDQINNLFPEGIRNYIWFQGESLESLINFRNKDTLKAAVKHISYYPFYEKLSEIISISKDKIMSAENRKLKEANKHNSSVKSLLSKIDLTRDKIRREENKKKEYEDAIEAINIALADGEQKISGLATFTSLVTKYKNCEIEIRKVLEESGRLDDYQRAQLPSLWVLRGIEPMLEECKRIIQKHTEEEFTLPEKKYLDNPSRPKLEEILREGRCYVCGTEFTEQDKQFHYIKERLRLQEEYLQEMEDYTNNMQFSKKFNMFVGRIQDYPDSLLVSLSSIDKQIEKNEDGIEKFSLRRKTLLDNKKELDKQIEEAKKKYGVDPVKQAETAGILSNTIRVSRSSLDSQKKKLQITKNTISNLNSDLISYQKELEKMGNSDNITSVPETEWKKISMFLEDICKRVQENARKELLHKIEKRANEFYVKFTEHDDGYKGSVKIGEDYSIEFEAGLNTSHEDRKKMSIINALLSLNQEAMGIYYPFISDAPTSNFDMETSYKYLLGIKDIFGQSIIMTKDVDLNSEKYRDLLTHRNIGNVYVLESELHSDSKEPGLHEISTKINKIK